MDFSEFAPHVDAAVARHQALGLPDEMSPFEHLLASDEDLDRAERELGVRLPEQYKEFMKRYGGGAFASLDLLPVTPRDREDLLEVNETERFSVPFVAIAPVGTGDWWGFKVNEGACSTEVSFYFFEEGSLESESPDFLTFATKQGLGIEYP
ncbi:SMI1/KNR4 family protein [Streptomyces sp. NPDC004237]|uniref:SMI1/KNR4 family protein n=1 Tax=Streptomyces sp. NPDC004237 TaxID=3154455 RepID=UPI0033AED3DE